MTRAYAFVGKDGYARSEPPPLRAKVLAFIQERHDAGDGFPTLQDIAEHMQWKSDRSAYQALCGLVGDGCLVRSFHREKPQVRFELAAS